MSCNGCRVLRKGCSDACILRPCLDWIESAEAQAHATVFVAKSFGRAGLMSFLSSVPSSHRPALFRSLLFEACGRAINPVNGAVGLLWAGKWHLCQAAVETVLRGGVLRPLPDLAASGEVAELYGPPPKIGRASSGSSPLCDLNLCLMPQSLPVAGEARRRAATPSRNSEESVTTSAGIGDQEKPRLLNLFV